MLLLAYGRCTVTAPVVLDELHTTFMAHELAFGLMVHEFEVMVPEAAGVAINVAVTAQFFVIAGVVYVAPESEPPVPQVEDTEGV